MLSSSVIYLIEKTFNLGEIYLVKIFKEKKVLGDFTLVFNKGETLVNHSYVALYANQVGMFLDRNKVTEMLRRSEAKYRNFVEKMQDGVYVLDSKGRFVDVNPALVKILGYNSKEELLSVDIESELFFSHDEYNSAGLVNSDGSLVAYRLKRKDGSEIWVEDHRVSFTADDGDTLYREGTLRDITDRRASEQELVIAKESAEKSDKLKSAFLANMSHEIRTPLNGIMGFTGLLKESGLSDESRLDYLKIIEQSGERLLKIINDIIDISKIEAGLMTVTKDDVSISALIGHLANFFKPEMDSIGIKFIIESSLISDGVIINTDSVKIHSIFTNLIKNAIKSTKEGSIEIGYKEDGEFLEFFVKDTGKGIPEEKLNAIFERFSTLEYPPSSQGTGLGLAITKAYVEILGGRIWVESRVGKGSTLFFTLRRR